MSILHSAIQHADCHEPRHITTSGISDAGKVITPSSSVAGTSVLRKLTFAEIDAGDILDTVLTIVDAGDVTKKAQFDPSLITAATTRTFAFPDENGTLVLNASTQTLTNKRVTARISNVSFSANLNVNSDSFDQLVCDSLTNNVNLNAPTGTPTEGQRLTYRLTQDATGGRSMTWNAAFVTTGADTTTLSTTTTRVFEWNVARSRWIQIAYTTGI